MSFTTLYCPNCREGRLCPVIPLYKMNKQKDRNFYVSDNPDIQWFRRGRICKNCGHKFLTAELSESLIFELFELRGRVSKKNASLVSKLRKKESLLSRKESIPKDIAIGFIKKSVYWWEHPSGSPCRAPGFADRIFESNSGWSLNFGANTFLVGVAIQRCVNKINDFLDEYSLGKLPFKKTLYEELEFSISGSVATSAGYEYSGFYPITDGRLIFGTHAIDLKDGIDYIIDQTNTSGYFL